jgi:ribose transport system ATP-binding protein
LRIPGYSKKNIPGHPQKWKVKGMSEIVLSMKNISKSFPGVKALDGINLEVRAGEVLALLGENGAGKSTLIKIMTGIYQPDGGTIELFGKETLLKKPSEAIEKGLSVIHQELTYLSDLSVGENIFLGKLPRNKLGWIKWNDIYKESAKIFKKMNVNIDPKAIMSSLSTAEKQLVEIAKAISSKIRILVMDEPTAALGTEDTDKLLKLIKDLVKNEGISVVYISHRLNELFVVSDRVVVLRDGKQIDTLNTIDATEEKMINLMVGREIETFYTQSDKITHNDTVLEIKDVSNLFLKNVSFKVHKGEILGLFGLMGAGCTEIANLIYGVDKKEHGEVKVGGKKAEINSPRKALKNGIAFLPSERKMDGLILPMDVKNNMILAMMKEFSTKLGWMKTKAIKDSCSGWVRKLNIKCTSINSSIESLSGGNQQKVVLAKWLSKKPKLIIFDCPTRGIDVGAKSEIYAVMRDMCEMGLGVIMISSELPELLAMSDRVVVVSGGRITANLKNENLTQEIIMTYAI